MMSRSMMIVAVSGLVLAWGSGAHAGLVIDTVTVGNVGNAGELSGGSYGGLTFPERICGAVDYQYNIGKFEVTAGQYTEFLNAVAVTDTYSLYESVMWTASYGPHIQRSGSPGSYTYSVAPDWANRPVNYTSWSDAARFSNWLHNGRPTGPQALGTTEDGSYFLNGATSAAELSGVVRRSDATWVIPSEDEWYKAAYHKNDGATGNYYDYPTSSDTVPGYVNDSRRLSEAGTLFVEGGVDPGNYATYSEGGIYDIPGIGNPYYRSEVGEWENSASPYGTFDQGGNVYEWTESSFVGTHRSIRGGGCNARDYVLHAQFRPYNAPTFENFTIGFRVGLVPEPTSLTLLAMGCVGLLARRRRLAR